MKIYSVLPIALMTCSAIVAQSDLYVFDTDLVLQHDEKRAATIEVLQDTSILTVLSSYRSEQGTATTDNTLYRISPNGTELWRRRLDSIENSEYGSYVPEFQYKQGRIYTAIAFSNEDSSGVKLATYDTSGILVDQAVVAVSQGEVIIELRDVKLIDEYLMVVGVSKSSEQDSSTLIRPSQGFVIRADDMLGSPEVHLLQSFLDTELFQGYIHADTTGYIVPYATIEYVAAQEYLHFIKLYHFDENFNLTNQTSLYDYEGGAYDRITDIVPRDGGGYYIHSSERSQNTQLIVLTKTNSALVPIWQTIAFDSMRSFRSNAVHFDNGNIAILGTEVQANQEVATVELLDSNGSRIWYRQFVSNDYPYVKLANTIDYKYGKYHLLLGSSFFTHKALYIQLDGNGCWNGDCGETILLSSVDVVPILIDNVALRVYPNPATELLTVERIDRAGELPHSIELYALDGKMLSRRSINGSQAKIHVKELPSGTYLLTYRIDGAIVSQRKVVIR